VNRLLLLRHAKAAAPGSGEDRERPLDDEGRQAAARLAGWMAEHRLHVDLALCSSAVRTLQTLDSVLPGFSPPPKTQAEDELYLADGKELLRRLRRLPETVTGVMLVGHNPGLEALARGLADTTTGPLLRRLQDGMPTAALVIFEVPVDWAALDWRCARPVAFVTPAQLAAGGSR
jgi:phosphohistidine phosphatase